MQQRLSTRMSNECGKARAKASSRVICGLAEKGILSVSSIVGPAGIRWYGQRQLLLVEFVLRRE